MTREERDKLADFIARAAPELVKFWFDRRDEEVDRAVDALQRKLRGAADATHAAILDKHEAGPARESSPSADAIADVAAIHEGRAGRLP